MNSQEQVSAKMALQKLKEGNLRFVKKRSKVTFTSKRTSAWLKTKEHGPFAIILSCSDARAPAEILFDQGLGDLFIIRVAGNIVAPSQVGSVEFAAATTRAQLVIVMGHTQCGAIRATLDQIEGKASVPGKNIQAIVRRIRPHIKKITSKQYDEIWREASRLNVLASVKRLRSGSRFLKGLIREKKLIIIGAEYCIETGLVSFDV